MKPTRRIDLVSCLLAFLFALPLAGSGVAQTTAFTYHGKLTESGNPANGTYDIQFTLFDTPTVGTGTQQGSTFPNPSVQVADGIFTVQLDFGDCPSCFNGAARYLEIAVRPAGNPDPHTILAPRQQLTSSPYAIQTVNAAQLAGLPASRYVATAVNGNIGIGTSIPSQLLHLNSATENVAALVQTPSNRFAQFQVQSGATNPWIIGTQDNFAGSGLLFRNGITNLMVIRPNGDVGIGTSSPSQRLHIFSGNAAALVQTPTNSFAQFQLQSGATNPWIVGTQDNFASNGLLFRNGVTDLMAIQPGGNVGIGTTSPQSKLAVQSSAHGITQTDGTVTVGTYIDSSGGWLGTRSNHPLYFFTGNSLQQMTLSTSGNLGIGTINPTAAKLHVNASSVDGVYASSDFHGMRGQSSGDNRAGLRGDGLGSGGFGLYGLATGDGNSTGVFGESTSSVGFGMFARSPNYGVWGKTTGSGRGVFGDNNGSDSVGYAGYFNGRVNVTGLLTKGGGAFKIDHPLDPEHRYLLHSFVESPDMMNIYNGNVTTDGEGNATVIMPDWFEALNQEFRYQLTVIGQFAQAIIAGKIRQNRFIIKTDRPHVEVSWQVTGIRHDAYARANRIPVEQEKPKEEAGYYLHPAAFGEPEEKSVEWADQREPMSKLKEPRGPAQPKPRPQPK